MKTLKYITYLFIGVLLFSSCEVEYLESPNNPKVAPTYGLLNRVQKRLMDDTRDAWFSGRQMLTWVQYWNQVNYTEEDRFQYRESVNKAAWDDLYKNAQDLIDIIYFNTLDETKADMALFGSNETQIAAARVMLVYTYLLATELWGDVPYWSYNSTNPNFQANMLKNVDNPNFSPVYASQAEIYPDMLNTLSECQDVFENASYVTDGDNFFNGDAGQWQKYTNSLRLRIANRVGDATHIADAIADGVMESNADNAGITYGSVDNIAAPMYRAFYVSNRTDFAPSYSFVELLKGNDTDFHTNQFSADPRLDVFVADNNDGFKVGIPLTDANGTVTKFKYESLPGEDILDNEATEIYMEYAEVCFLLSEVNMWDQTWYEAGVRASMERWGIATAEIDAYIATLPPASEENVMMQKYIALYMQSMEAWSELRRTGYPNNIVTKDVPGDPNGDGTYNVTWQYLDGGTVMDTTAAFMFLPIGIDMVPNRNRYLVNEANINGANYEAAGAAMGGDTQTSKMIWQQ